MNLHFARTRGAVAALALITAVAACSEGPTSPTARPRPGALALNTTTDGASLTLCKQSGPAGSTWDFTVGVNALHDPSQSIAYNTTLVVGGCFVWTPTDPNTVADVTITETNGTPDSIVVVGQPDPTSNMKFVGRNSITLRMSFQNGWFVKVYNSASPPPPPPGGSEGCTPGYWKQKQHFGSWTGYTQGQSYNTVFGVNLFSSSFSLLQALGQGGGGPARLGRHSTAALLNTANANVDYGMTTADVIAAVQAAVASGDYDSASNVFEKLNERGCNLGRNE